MELYFQRHPAGKKFHDPLAACAMLEPEICTFREVHMFRERGKGGAELAEGTNTFISIAADKQRFMEVFTETE